MSLINKIQALISLTTERANIVWQSKQRSELSSSLALLRDYFLRSFTSKEKLITLLGLLGIFWFVGFLFDNLTFREIDRTLDNQQSARAETLIRQKMLIMPGNHGLQLRLAHAYLGLEREKEAKSIIENVQLKESKNPYLPKVAMALAGNLKRQGKAYQAIPILDKIPTALCRQCKGELLELYSIEGRESLTARNLERANFFLSKALTLAEEAHESSSSLNHRKRELARAYNLQASQLIKAKEEEKAIGVLEKSIKIFPNGQSHLLLAKLYCNRGKNSADFKKALQEYEKAYSFGLTDNFNISEYHQAVSKLKKALNDEGSSRESIDKTLQAFTLIENDIKARQEQATREAVSSAKKEDAKAEDTTSKPEENKVAENTIPDTAEVD